MLLSPRDYAAPPVAVSLTFPTLSLLPPSDSTLVSLATRPRSLARCTLSRANPQTGDAIDRTAEQKIGNECEKERHVDRFGGINAAEHEQLVDEVEDDRHYGQLPDRDEALADQAPAVIGAAEDSPEEWRSPGTGIAQPVADGEQRGHRRLQEQAECEGTSEPSDEVVPDAHQRVFHRTSPLGRRAYDPAEAEMTGRRVDGFREARSD